MAENDNSSAMDWAKLLLGAGQTYLDYDAKKQQAELNNNLALAQTEVSPLVAQANAEAEASKVQKYLISGLIIGGAFIIGVGVMKLFSKW